MLTVLSFAWQQGFACGECVGVIEAEGVYEHADGFLEGQGGLRTSHIGEAMNCVAYDFADARQVDVGLVGRIVCLSLLLF